MQLAEGFGVEADAVRTPSELVEALQRSFKQEVPMLIVAMLEPG